jgi:hypothetical protein
MCGAILYLTSLSTLLGFHERKKFIHHVTSLSLSCTSSPTASAPYKEYTSFRGYSSSTSRSSMSTSFHVLLGLRESINNEVSSMIILVCDFHISCVLFVSNPLPSHFILFLIHQIRLSGIYNLVLVPYDTLLLESLRVTGVACRLDYTTKSSGKSRSSRKRRTD